MWSGHHVMLTTSPTSPSSSQQQPLELITSEDFLPITQDDFHDENSSTVLHHRSKRALSSSSLHMVHSNNIGRNVGAKHVFLKSQDYSLFRKSERLVWQLNHLHANINQLITKNHNINEQQQGSSFLTTTTSATSPTSPSLLSTNNSKNIQVISASIKTCKDLSVRRNRFLKNHIADSHHHHNSSMDESTFTSGFMLHSSEYSMDRNSMQNSPTTTISDESYLNQLPFTHDSIPRSMSIDQLNQATNSNIVRSISIDQIHYGGSNQQGGVVILPPNFYNGNESSPKFNQFHGHEETVSSTTSTEEFTEDLGIELLPNSLVHTIYSKYGIVITVDISPSMLAIDTTTGEVLFDRVFKTISNILTHLTQPVIVPNYSQEILPELHVTCIAIGMSGRPVYCLFQDYHITSTNLIEVLGKIYQNLCETENMASNSLKPSLKSLSENSNSKFNTYISDSILAFDFLPKDACPIFLLISDNVFNISDLTPETILSINQKDISFSTINITNQSQGAYLYSYLPDSELVESFISCVDGCYIDYEYIEETPSSENDRRKTNAIQHALLFRPSPVLAVENESLIILAGEGGVFSNNHTDVKKDVKKGYIESDILSYALNMTSVDSILKTRAKQGFKIMDLKYATNTDSLTKFKAEEEKLDYKFIKMSLLYRRNIEIVYKMQIDRTDVLNEEQDLQMLSSGSFTNFALTKLKSFKIVVSISVFMHKSNQERFKTYLKKRPKELAFFKSMQDFIQNINIEDVLLEQYHNLADNCSCTNRTPIRKLDLSNINFDHDLFDRQTLMLSLHNDEQHLHRSDSIIQKILAQIQSGTIEITTVQNHISILRTLCENGWSSTKISDDFYILFLSEQDSTCYLYESVDDTSLLSMEEKDSCVSSGFCLLKLLNNFNSPIEIQFQFFNVSSFTISRMIRQFKEKITRAFHQKGISANFYVSEHFPEIASRLPNCKEDESHYSVSLYSAPPHYTSYMKHKNWVWSVGGRLNVAGILSSIFSQRFSEGFSLVSSKQSIIFVKELEIMKRNAFSSMEYLSKLLVFYCIHILKKEKKLITELWIEPQSGYVTYSSGALADSSQFYSELCDNWFYNLDLQIISLFSTFECVVTACKSGKGNNNNITVFQAEKNNLPTPFNLKGIVDRSEKQDLQFKVFKISTSEESELCKKNNILLYDRLIKFLTNINDVELNIDRIPLNLATKSRCFARVFETVGSERQKDFILTIVPAQVNGDESHFNIMVCECNEDQLLNIENLKHNEAIEKLVCSKNGAHFVKAHPMLMHDEEQFSSSASYCDFVTNLHSYSLSYGVYKHLNQKLLVDRENIVSAVESCYEYREEIDLSEFFEAILLARSYFFEKGENGVSPCESMSSAFKAIIEKYFDDIRGTKYHYYLRESSIPKSKNQSNVAASNPKILKKKNSAKSFDHLEEIENEDNFDAEASDDDMKSFHSEEDDIHSISTGLSAGARDTHPHSDHASDSLTDSSNSSLSDTFNSVELENSTIPVFMRMECVLSPIERDHDSWNELDNDSENSSTTIKVPIRKLPIDKIASTIMSSKGEFTQVLSAFSKDEESEDEDEEPENFTRSTSLDLDWINSLNSVKTSLRLYCITLPPDKHYAAMNGFEPAKKDLLMMFRNHVTESQFAYARSVFDVEEDSSADVPTDEAAPYLDKGYLPRHIRRIMSRTNKRLQALISKEILNALLKTHPITSYSIKKVFDNIEKLPATCYQKHSIPLFFIDPIEGLKLFHQEIAKCKNLVFKNIENHYILYFRKRNCCSKHTIFEDFDKACEQDTTSDNNKYNLYKKELDDLETVIFDNDIEMDRTCLELPFWIILRVENKKSMSMLFYSPSALSTKHASDVVSVVFKAVNVICKRVNTLLLLSNLHDTRLCSSLLLPFRKDKDKKALQNEVNTLDKKFIRKENEKPNPEKFKEGDFACRKTHEISFPLHSRLTTAMAINHLNQAVFNPFIVANRSEMFVYKERSGRVFYLQLVDGNKQSDVLSPTSEKSPEIPEQPQSDEYKTKLKDYSLSLSSMGQYLYAELDLKNKTSSIILEVYGVYSPSAEITAQLKNLIEGKLSSLTMNIISNLLLRNRQFKVNVEDLEFIRPLLQKPQKSVFINIPKFINNKLLFMLFLRNNMLTFMNQLYLSSSDDSTDSNNPQAYMSFTEDEDDDMVFKAWDFSFLFNSVTQNTFSRAMTSTVNCRGIACVQLTLLNHNGEMVTVFPTMKESYACDLTGVSQLGNLQEEPANIPYTDFGAPILKKEGSNSDSEDDEEETSTEIASKSLCSENGKILFEFWKKGEVDISSLLEKIVQTVNQSVIDYIIECGLFTNPLSLEGFNRYFLARLQTQAIKASRIDSPTLTEHRASIFLPLWEMGRFVGDLYNLLSAYSFKFRPITFASTDGRQTFAKYSRSEDFTEKYHLIDSNNVCFAMIAGNILVQNNDRVINIGENIKIGDIISLEGFNYRNSFKYNRKCCIVIILTSAELQVIAYNWKTPQFEKFKYHLHQTVSWLRCRAHLLNSILHQKLGLFYHSHSSNLVSIPQNPLNPTTPSGKPQKEVQFAFNNIDLLIYNKQNAPVDPKATTTIRRTTTPSTATTPTVTKQMPDVRGQIYNRFKTPQNPTQIQVPTTEIKSEIAKPIRKEKKPQSSKNQFGSLLKGIYDLDKNPGRYLNRRTSSAVESKKDQLLIHGLHFKHIVHQNYKKKVEQQQVSKIYGFWNNKSYSTSLKSKDFQLIKNSSRLIHFCRVPLLFNPLRRILFDPSPFVSSSSAAIIQQMDLGNTSSFEDTQNNNLREIGYHRKVFESFLSEYVEYVKSLDISDVFLNPSEQSDIPTTPGSAESNLQISVTRERQPKQPTPLVQVVGNQIIKLQPTTIYFQKQMDEGVLFLELGLDSIYAYLNVYVSDTVSPKPSGLMHNRSSSRGEFLKKVSQFKHSLHMNSFSYDFHLRNFLNYLTTDYSGFPPSLSFMCLLKDFAQFYPKPPPHTRNILHSHHIVFENSRDIADIIREKANVKMSGNLERKEMLNDPFHFFFEYICKNSDRYRVKFNQKSKECFILDTYISHDEADYSYCVIVTKSVENSTSHISPSSPVLEEMFESPTMNLSMYIVFADATNRHPYDSEVEGSKESMYKIVTQMAQQYERKLLNLLHSVKDSFKLDILWDMAVQFKISENLFNDLDNLWIKTPITDYDFTLSIFEANYIPWNDVISELWNIYGGDRAGSIFKKDGTVQHLIITPENMNQDYLLHVNYSILSNTVSCYLCKKRLLHEPELLQELQRSSSPKMEGVLIQDPRMPNEQERDFIGTFVNRVCYILYRLSF